MTRRYRVEERDAYKQIINVISGDGSGIDRPTAETLATILRTGTAYTGPQARTLDIVPIATPAEILAARLAAWRTNRDATLTPAEQAAALRQLADELESLDSEDLGDIHLSVVLDVDGYRADPALAKARVDRVAKALNLDQAVAAESGRNWWYNTNSSLPVQVRAVGSVPAVPAADVDAAAVSPVSAPPATKRAAKPTRKQPAQPTPATSSPDVTSPSSEELDDAHAQHIATADHSAAGGVR